MAGLKANLFPSREQDITLEDKPTFVLQNAYNEVTERIRSKELEVHELQVLQLELYEEIQSRLKGADAPMDDVAE